MPKTRRCMKVMLLKRISTVTWMAGLKVTRLSLTNVLLCGFAAFATGMPAVGALWLTSFFMSIMFPTIFALGVEGLGEETESGAAFLIMAIIGGAVFPPLMGLVSERVGGVHHMMLVPMLAFAGVLYFAVQRLREGRTQ